jgi:hypothetical protein
MRRFLRVVAILGALAGLAWAMRERMISIQAPREETPPTFRVAEEDTDQPAEPA